VRKFCAKRKSESAAYLAYVSKRIIEVWLEKSQSEWLKIDFKEIVATPSKKTEVGAY